MIGFVGQRQVIDAGGGLVYQRVRMRNDEERSFWQGLYKPDENFRAIMAGNELFLNPSVNPGSKLVFQGPEERQEWGKVFIQSPSFNHFARWESPHMLLLGSEPAPVDANTVQSEGAPEQPEGEEQWRLLSDKKFRARAAELGLPNIDPAEGREMLLARLKRHLAEQAEKV